MTEEPKQEDPKNNDSTSKGQGGAGSKKDDRPGVDRQQAAQGPAGGKPAAEKAPERTADRGPEKIPEKTPDEKTPEKTKPLAATSAAATPTPSRSRAEDVGKEPGRTVNTDSPDSAKAPSLPAGSAAAGPASPPTKPGAPEKPTEKPAMEKPGTDTSGTGKPAMEKSGPDMPRKAETPSVAKAETSGTPKPGASAKSEAGPSQPAAEPWKSAAGPAAAASAASSQPSRSESLEKKADEKKGEGTRGPGAPRAGMPEGKGPPPPAPPKRRSGCLALGAVLAILLIGGLLTSPYWGPALAPYAQSYLPAQPGEEQIAALEDRIAELEQTVQQGSAREDGAAALQQDVEALRAQMDTLGGRLQDIEPGVTAVVPEWVDERLSAVRSESQQLDERVAGLNQQLAGLDERVAGLDRKVSDLAPQDSGIEETVAGLEQQITRTQEQVASLEEQVRSLSERVPDTRDVSQDAAAVALGLSRLSETLGTSRSYRQELDAFKSAADEALLDAESLQPLEMHAETGVATFADLYRRFPELADAVAHAGVERDEDGVLQTTFSRLRSLVTIRRTGEAAVEAGGADAVLEAARNRMDAGDLAGAIDALAQLEGAEAEAAAWWLDAARARLAVRQAMERIQIRAIAMLSSEEGSSR